MIWLVRLRAPTVTRTDGEACTPSHASRVKRVGSRFHAVGSPDAAKILPANLVLFRSRGEALASGFEAARRRTPEEGEESNS